MNRYSHLKWHTKEGREISWKETLQAMCAYYGTFCGRWHSNEFWKLVSSEIPNMSEDQCQQKIIQIESEADDDLAYWQAMQ